jgi:hypothetical protein
MCTVENDVRKSLIFKIVYFFVNDLNVSAVVWTSDIQPAVGEDMLKVRKSKKNIYAKEAQLSH